MRLKVKGLALPNKYKFLNIQSIDETTLFFNLEENDFETLNNFDFW